MISHLLLPKKIPSAPWFNPLFHCFHSTWVIAMSHIKVCRKILLQAIFSKCGDINVEFLHSFLYMRFHYHWSNSELSLVHSSQMEDGCTYSNRGERRIDIWVSEVNQSYLFSKNRWQIKCFPGHKREMGKYLFMRELNHKKMLFCDKKWPNVSNFMWPNLIKRL